MALKIGNKAASMTIKGADQAILFEIIGAANEQIVKAMQAGIDKVAADAFEGWPKEGEPDYDSSRSINAKRQTLQRARGGRGWVPTKREPGTDERGSAFDLRHETVVNIELGSITGRVWNDNPHGKYIKANKLGNKSVFVELIRKPMNKLTKKLLVVIPKIVAGEFDG